VPDDLAAAYLAKVEAAEAPRLTSSGTAECLVARLIAEGRLTERQFLAAARFREAHHKASMGFKLTHAWPKAMAGRLQPAWREPDTEATQRHRAAYMAMIEAVGAHLAVALLTIAVHDRPPREYGREVFQYRNVNSAAAAGLVSLIHALDLLAVALGLAE